MRFPRTLSGAFERTAFAFGVRATSSCRDGTKHAFAEPVDRCDSCSPIAGVQFSK